LTKSDILKKKNKTLEEIMGFKQVLKKEAASLKSFKKVYETVAFLALAVLIFQQLFYLVVNIINFSRLGFFSVNNFCTSNLQGFVARIVGINNTSVVFMILGILAWFVYYFFLYLLVFRFAQKQKMAKWTWTLFVAFGPTILFVPSYIWFILFAFRKPLMIVMKKILAEFNETEILEDEEIEEEEIVEEDKEEEAKEEPKEE